MDTQPAVADCIPPIELLRKRTMDEVLEKSPTIKVPRLSSMDQWSSPLSHFTNGIAQDDGDDSITIERYNIRDRRKTDFFTPESSTKKGQTMNDASRVKVYENARRSLSFEDVDSNGIKVPVEEREEEESPQNSPPHLDLLIKADSDPVPNGATNDVVRYFPVGNLVWGKLPGYNWWPGCVMSYDKKEMEKFKEEMETDEEETESLGGGEEGGETAWVKWFGDNQLSLLACRKLRDFSQFNEFFSPSKMKGLYRKAMLGILREAAKRCHVDALFKPEDKKLSWSFNFTLCSQLMKKSVAVDELPREQSSSDQVLLPSLQEVFVQEAEGLSTSDSKRKGNKRGTVCLGGEEKELLQWALNSFLPSGPEGFKPKPEHLLDVKIVPMGPKSEQDTTYSPVVNGRGKKEGGASRKREFGTNGEKEKLMIIENVSRNKAQFELVAQGQINIEDICVGCGRSSIVAKHPLFHGGLCAHCKDMFMECAYLFDDDGTQMYCTICSAGNEVFMCDTPNCSKVFCGICIEKLCGEAELVMVNESDKWQCYMCCAEGTMTGQMRRRDNWDKELHDLFLNDNEMEFDPAPFYPPISAEDRKPIKALGLFDGIGTGLLVLKELGIEVDLYVASEIDLDAVKVSRVNHAEMRHVGAVEYITQEEVKAWGPFDLVMGGSPCNDLSIVNPARKGIYEGTGRLFFEFYRILNYARPHPDDPRPFFWVFENVVSMRAPDKQIISRFLQCNPVVVDARDISAAHRARYFWGNLPGMNRPTVPLPGDRLSLQSCLEPNCFRTAQFNKLRTVTTKMNSIKQTKKAIFPVRMLGDMEKDGDVLWCTEMERLFGFPPHYTDVGNLGRCGRQKLLGKAWSVPVARHILSPLKDYFKSRTTGIPLSVKFGASSDSDVVSTATVTNGSTLVISSQSVSLVATTPAQSQMVKDLVEIQMTQNVASCD